MKNKTILITGASRGIGKAIAKKFITSTDYNIVINCFQNINLLEDLANEYKDLNSNILPIKADLSNYSEVLNMFSKIESVFGSVDILINNAGISYVGLFNQMSYDEIKKITDTNINSVIYCSHIAVSNMIKNKYGKIINISSIWGDSGASCEVIYSASKGAVNAFTKALAKELGPSSINVNAVACGFIDTDMNSWLTPEEKNDFIESIPMMRPGKTEEVSELVSFLASEKANYITGQIINIDGGFL